MQWIAISGTWRTSLTTVESTVRERVRAIIRTGDGIITGGALGVDFWAVDEALREDSDGTRTRVLLTSSLQRYAAHYRKRAKEGVITLDEANQLIDQLERVKRINPSALVEGTDAVIDKMTYYTRNTRIIDAADAIEAFVINNSPGTLDTIAKARAKGIPVHECHWTVDGRRTR